MNEGNSNAKKVSIIAGVVAILVIIAVVVAMSMTNNTSNSSTMTPPADTSDSSTDTTAATITYVDGTFSPATITIKQGDKVAVKNNSSSELHFDSNPHPVHTDNTELNVDDVGSGQTKTFTVTKKGTFGYHNHVAPSEKGTIVVE